MIRRVALAALLLLAACERPTKEVVRDSLRPVTSAHPPGGSYGTIQYVTLAGEEASVIHWETEGASPPPGHPTSGSAQNPIYWIRIGPGTTTLRYYAVDRAGNREATRTETYVIEVPTP